MGDLWDFGTVRNVRNGTVRSVRGMNSTRRRGQAAGGGAASRTSVTPVYAQHSFAAAQGPPPIPEKARPSAASVQQQQPPQRGAPSLPARHAHQQGSSNSSGDFADGTVRQAAAPTPAAAAGHPRHSQPAQALSHQPHPPAPRHSEPPQARLHLSESSVHAPRDEFLDDDELAEAEDIMDSVVLPVLDQVCVLLFFASWGGGHRRG